MFAPSEPSFASPTHVLSQVLSQESQPRPHEYAPTGMRRCERRVGFHSPAAVTSRPHRPLPISADSRGRDCGGRHAAPQRRELGAGLTHH